MKIKTKVITSLMLIVVLLITTNINIGGELYRVLGNIAYAEEESEQIRMELDYSQGNYHWDYKYLKNSAYNGGYSLAIPDGYIPFGYDTVVTQDEGQDWLDEYCYVYNPETKDVIRMELDYSQGNYHWDYKYLKNSAYNGGYSLAISDGYIPFGYDTVVTQDEGQDWLDEYCYITTPPPPPDTTPPDIQLSYTPTEITKTPVTINCTITDQSEIAVKKWTPYEKTTSYFQEWGTELTGTSFEVTENGTYTVYAKDEKGNEAVKTITITNIDCTGPEITFEVTTNNDLTYQAQINMTINDTPSGLSKYRYKWISNPPPELMGETIQNTDLAPYMGEWTTITGAPSTTTTQVKFRQSGTWYLFAQAEDNNENLSSKRLDQEIKIDTLAPKIPSIKVEFDNNGIMQISWTPFQEYTQAELDQINSENGYTYETADGETIYVQSTEGNIKMVSSGFGEMRLYVQKWGKIDEENYGWYNILKDQEYIKITNENQINQAITDTLTKETIDGKGARYRVNIRHIDKAALDYISDYGIKDEWDKNIGAQKYKDTTLETGEKINIDNIENISDSGWKETYANIGTVTLQYQAIPLEWDKAAGRGQIILTWNEVEGAIGYYTEIYDGNQWNRYDIGDTTKWDSSIAKIYPTEAYLKSYEDNTHTEEIFIHNKQGLELRDNPRNIYLKTPGQIYDNEATYLIRVRPYITVTTTATDGVKVEEQIEGPVGPESVVKIQMPNRTDLKNPGVATLVEYIEQYKAAYITVTMSDTESGPKEIIPYNTNGVTLISSVATGQYITNIYKVYTNGTYTFTVKDNVGRYTIKSVEIKNINPNKPIIIFNREGRVISEMYLSQDTENVNYTKYGCDVDIDLTANQTIENGIINVGLIIKEGKDTYTTPYYIKLKSGDGTELNKKFNITIDGSKTEIIEEY